MSGERQGGRKAMEHMADHLIEHGGMAPQQAHEIARNAARRSEDGRRDDGHQDNRNTWAGGGAKRR